MPTRLTDPSAKSLSLPPIPRGVERDDPNPPTPPRDWRAVPMPPQIAALPLSPDNGYPVFFSIQPPPPADPSRSDFRHMQEGRVRLCAAERRCGICGEPLGHWLWFAGGTVACATRWFSDPPMHRDCLEYAFLVCPFLLRGGFKRPPSSIAARLVDDPHATLGTQDGRTGLYRTRDYRFPARDGSLGFEAAAPKEIIWRGDLTAGWRHGADTPKLPQERRSGAGASAVASDATAPTPAHSGPLTHSRTVTISAEARRKLDAMYGNTEEE